MDQLTEDQMLLLLPKLEADLDSLNLRLSDVVKNKTRKDCESANLANEAQRLEMEMSRIASTTRWLRQWKAARADTAQSAPGQSLNPSTEPEKSGDLSSSS